MSSNNDESENGTINCCASCGATEGDGIKLRTCTACKSVKYCGVKCQKEHRSKHKRECKKRAAELRDEILFRQPESTCYGDCPICFLPLPLDQSKSDFSNCCSKTICQGCSFAYAKRACEQKLTPKCPFCRCDLFQRNEIHKRTNERLAKMNDPALLCQRGIDRRDEGNYETAFAYFSRAAQLGDAVAHNELCVLYHSGRGVKKSEAKAFHHMTQAAIGGHPLARAGLGNIEYENGCHDRAVRHWMIAASHGEDESLRELKISYEFGRITKDVFASALRAYQAAVDATESKDRKEAESYFAGLPKNLQEEAFKSPYRAY